MVQALHVCWALIARFFLSVFSLLIRARGPPVTLHGAISSKGMLPLLRQEIEPRQAGAGHALYSFGAVCMALALECR